MRIGVVGHREIIACDRRERRFHWPQSIRLNQIPATAESTTTTRGGARQTTRGTKPVAATAKSVGFSTALSKPVLREHMIDYMRATPVHAGGLTQVRRIADLAALWQIRTAFHGASDMSPVTFGAALRLGRALPNFGIQEYAGHSSHSDDVIPRTWGCSDGSLTTGEVPGPGVDIDENAAARFPYVRSYLPVNRLADGTLWNW